MSEPTRMTDEEFGRIARGERPHPSDEQDVVVEAARARASEGAKDKEIERLKADNAEQHRILVAVWRKVAAMHYEGLGLKEAIDADHPGAELLEELTRLRATIRDIGERLVAAGGTRDGTILEQLNSILQRTDAKAP